MSLFIAFEGGEGTGKSTQIELLRHSLEELNRKVTSLREPGGTPLGEYLRDWLVDESRSLEPESELFLFAAARAELVRTVIKPQLQSGSDVLLDRYAASTTVYQGFARKIPLRHVNAANSLATDDLVPALTVLLDAPPEISLNRAQLRDVNIKNTKRFEQNSISFHQTVRDGFLRLASNDPAKWLVIDAEQTVENIHSLIRRKVKELIP